MPNLMSLVNTYGVSASKGFVSFDYEAAAAEAEAEAENAESTDAELEATEAETAEGELTVTETTETETELPDKHLVEAAFNSAHEAFVDFDGFATAVIRANHIDISSELDSNVIVTPMLTTDAKCFIDGVSDSEGQKTVAVAIETNSDDPTRILWFTGADAFEGDDFEVMNAYASIYSILWGVDVFEPSLEVVEAKPISSSMISSSTKAVLTALVIFVVAIPALLTIAGIVMAVKFKKAPVTKKTEAENDNESTQEE